MTDEQRKNLKELAQRYSLTKDDFHADKRNFVMIKRCGIDKIQRQASINIEYIVEKLEKTQHFTWVVIKAVGTMAHPDTGEMQTIESLGEAAPENCTNKYFVAMAQKRAKARVVLELTRFYEYNVYSEDEIDENEPRIQVTKPKKS